MSDCDSPNRPEVFLSDRDSVLARIIRELPERWPRRATEDPIFGLIRMVIAQQISTKAAVTLATRVAPIFANPESLRSSAPIDPRLLRACGISPRKAECCADIIRLADSIRWRLMQNEETDRVLGGIRGIGPWTRSMFRIFVLRQSDVLPEGDLALTKAILQHYGIGSTLAKVSEVWRPFRSVACWYLWRSLGNPQLG
jgi:DNA-3-methyladenine glycosylase II